MPSKVRRPSFSAILATRDRPQFLADALRSIERQTLAPLEVRIADDGETPLDPESLGFTSLHMTLRRSDARQLARARNLAARDASGEVLAFLDDDDLWLPHHLERLARAFENPAVELAYTDCAIVREIVEPGGRRSEIERRVIARDWDPEMMRDNDYIPPSGMAVRRELFERLEGFDPAFKFSEDWDFLMRAARETTPRRVPGVTVEVRMRRHGNWSADFGPERLDCLARLSERHDLPKLEPRTFWEVAAVAAGPRR